MKPSSSRTWSRRELLGASALTIVGAPVSALAQPGPVSGFAHHTLNGWITELATEPDPKLNAGNANAMSASEPQSHAWMERVLDCRISPGCGTLR